MLCYAVWDQEPINKVIKRSHGRAGGAFSAHPSDRRLARVWGGLSRDSSPALLSHRCVVHVLSVAGLSFPFLSTFLIWQAGW